MLDARLSARRYTREHGEDDPEIGKWTWDPKFKSAKGSDGRHRYTGSKCPTKPRG